MRISDWSSDVCSSDLGDHWRSGFGGRPEESTEKGVIFRDVPVEVIDDFLTRFECHSTFSGQKSDVVSYLERIATKRPLADVLLISLSGGSGGDNPFTLRTQAIGRASCRDRVCTYV